MPINMVADTNYELVLRGVFNASVVVNNVFHYRSFLGDAPALAGGQPGTIRGAAEALWDTIKVALRANTTTLLLFQSIFAYQLDADGNVVSGEGHSIPPADQAGLASGDALPPVNAYTFQYVRPNTSFKHGYKRFAGVSELANANGFLAGGSPTTNATQLAINLAANLIPEDPGYGLAGAAYHLFPIILKKISNGMPVSPNGWAQPSSVIFKGIGTQTSRKYGVGI